MKLVIGDKNYSSWSMRPWLVLKHFGIAFEEVMVLLNEAESKASILEHSPSGKVPCLIADDGVTVWDSLAICETLAERYPQHAMWPRDAVARGHARSVSAEMHSGFGALRNNMWMNIRASFPGKGATPEALADIARIDEVWSECLEAYGGPFLFGEFTIADAMYAPVVMRFNTWQPKLSEAALAYSRRVTAQPAVKAWIDDALQETHRIPYQDTCA
ncbi:glutathione S-transferase domain-containing protein [Paraburkholderia hospita]|jgi:glutathione S-transferase|uniref:Glutathione S-transferase domain-containing protein n=1 Tax=Paraburkholderia hospita TaxID=169430 RepID=A0ABP2PBS9_9BURK|nr:glutathione S-transferase family protein [Paraburkholderia hospita]EIM95183.1 glutathione S-transferase domain-containing protein [Paraburkholderia hospita]OUL91253.1 glutathione S-transferase [Paraburkholderia hospita]OUL94024.1 glutathione S-transferase [Paraburkholderia hospita]SKC63988.1 Glutathione S-transferase [Burkholderia sp. CF099]